MYTVKKRDAISEQFCVKTKNGDYIFDVEINVNEKLVKDFRHLQMRMLELDKLREEHETLEILEELGACTIDFIALFFGAKSTEKLFEIYQNPTELLQDVAPFIQTVIVPKIDEYAKEYRKKMPKTWKKSKYTAGK